MTEADDTDRVSVEYELVSVERVAAGRIMATATVRLDIAGVVLTVSGFTMRRAEDGHADILVPQYRDPATGAWKPALDLPKAVMDAIAAEVVEAVTGRPARLVA